MRRASHLCSARSQMPRPCWQHNVHDNDKGKNNNNGIDNGMDNSNDNTSNNNSDLHYRCAMNFWCTSMRHRYAMNTCNKDMQ